MQPSRRSWLRTVVDGIEKTDLFMKITSLFIFIVCIFSLFNGQTLAQKTAPKDKQIKIKEPISSIHGCPANPDPLYDRQKILKQFSKTYEDRMKKTYGENYVVDRIKGALFVFDLTDPSNNNAVDIATGKSVNGRCVNFIDGHVYHFSWSVYSYSLSQIAVLENGKVKVFESINCEDSKDKLEDVVAYLNKRLVGNKNKDEILIRVKNYRKYGFYINFEFPRLLACQEIPYNSADSDDRYNGMKILRKFNEILDHQSPKLFSYSVIRKQAIGFFVYDLTDPSNKQTSLLERVNFINDHIYHFAYIDGPYSFSNIAVLHDGEIKIFRAINCKKKGDDLKDVIKYVNDELKDDKIGTAAIERLHNYRDYGVYASLNGISTPKCEQLKLSRSE